MMDVFDLQAKIKLDSTEYNKGLSDAGKNMNTFGSKISSVLGTVAKVTATSMAAVTAAVGAGTAALVKGVNSVATYGDNIDKMSQKLGMSAEAYQEWDAVMQHCGTTIDSMQTSMKTLASAAETGNDAFEKLGITQEQIASMSQEQLFSATITALQNIDSETERTYLAGQLLGRGATELGALLNTSAEDTEKMKQRVHELGGVMSDEAVKAAAKYKDSLQDMKTAMGGMLKGVTTEFLPAFTDVMDGIASVFSGDEGGADLITKGLDNIMENISSASDKLKPALSRIGTIALEVIKTATPNLIKGGTQILANVIKGTIKNLPEILDTAFDAVKGMGEGFLEIMPDWVADDIKHIFGTISNTFKSIDIGSILESFKGFGSSLENVAQKIGDAFVWLNDNVVSPIITWAANDILPNLFTAMGGAIDIMAAACEVLKGPLSAIWDILKPIAEGAGDVIAGTFDLMAKAIGGLAEEFEGVDWSGFWDDINNGEFFADWESGWEDISNWFSDHDKDIEEFFDVSELGHKWREFWEGVGGDVQEAQERWTLAFELLRVGLSSFADSWKLGAESISTAITKIKDAFNGFVDAWKTGWKELTGIGEKAHDSTEGTLGGIVLDAIISKIPAFGDGAYVTKPTLAVIGEKEHEYAIPESKMNEITNNSKAIHVEKVEFIVNGSFDIGSPEDRRKLIEEISADLQNLSIAEQRALGGAGWR